MKVEPPAPSPQQGYGEKGSSRSLEAAGSSFSHAWGQRLLTRTARQKPKSRASGQAAGWQAEHGADWAGGGGDKLRWAATAHPQDRREEANMGTVVSQSAETAGTFTPGSTEESLTHLCRGESGRRIGSFNGEGSEGVGRASQWQPAGSDLHALPALSVLWCVTTTPPRAKARARLGRGGDGAKGGPHHLPLITRHDAAGPGCLRRAGHEVASRPLVLWLARRRRRSTFDVRRRRTPRRTALERHRRTARVARRRCGGRGARLVGGSAGPCTSLNLVSGGLGGLDAAAS